MSGSDLVVERENADAGVVVRVRGELDLHTHQRLREVLSTPALRGNTLVVDLSGVTFMDSSGIGALGMAQQVAGDEGLALVVQSTHLRKLIRIAGLDRSATICTSVPEALLRLSPGG